MSGDSDKHATPASHDSGPRSGPGSDGSGGGSGKRGERARGARAGQHVCVFWLGGDRYALDAVLVREVVAVPEIGRAHV